MAQIGKRDGSPIDNKEAGRSFAIMPGEGYEYQSVGNEEVYEVGLRRGSTTLNNGDSVEIGVYDVTDDLTQVFGGTLIGSEVVVMDNIATNHDQTWTLTTPWPLVSGHTYVVGFTSATFTYIGMDELGDSQRDDGPLEDPWNNTNVNARRYDVWAETQATAGGGPIISQIMHHRRQMQG